MDSNSIRGSTGQLSNSGSTGGGMHHSHSTPAGVDGGARTPPATPKKGGKMLAMRVQMLDDTITIFQVQAKAMGRVLFDQVCKQLHLLEADYFGLEYSDNHGTKYWLDLQKPISRQLGLSLVDPLLYFCVKFYTPDPGQLEEEYTRYLFCLQIKRDLSQGLMQCNENTAALMASYIVQAECGDYVAEDYPDHSYLSSYKFVPQQDQEMERKIMENHKKHAGQSPAEADLNLLETARRCELYGMKMHPAKDHENVPLNLAVAHMGILVFQNYTKINTFSWAKIRKISFKRKRFLIKLHPEGYGYYKDTVEFFFEGRNECKNFWKKCVENHGFFRCASVKTISRHKTRVLSRGSSFRYSGKTQKQIVEFVRDNYVKRQTFQRSASFRHSSAHSSATNMHSSTVGNSISAHPLLPLADSNLSVEVSKLSTSLGSMGVSVGPPASPTTMLASRHRVTATSWSSAPDTRPTIMPAQMTTSPSPPLTTQSASPVTSATTSPLHTPYTETKPYASSSPVAVRAAVHRADIATGTTITTTIRTHTTSVRMPSSHKSEGSLDQSPPFDTNDPYPTQTRSQNDLGLRSKGNQVQIQTNSEYTYKSMTALPKRQIWQRSASCRDLYDFSFEDSGKAKRRSSKISKTEKSSTVTTGDTNRKLESPVTTYDDHRAIYTTRSRDSSLEIHQDIMMPDQKVYSSSYPGTTSYSQESMEDPGNYDLRDSQDDLSHDSYELIEKSDDDYSTSGGDYKKYKKSKPLNARSCSLDSGNYLPSDTDSDDGKRHKCKSSSDVHQDIFAMDDPRDLPREIIPRKSDGSFYKMFRVSSRTSSQESKSDYYETKPLKSSRENLKRSARTLERTSSAESKSDYDSKKRKHKTLDHLDSSRASSVESRSSEYYDATSNIVDEPSKHRPGEYDRRINFERNYGTQKGKQELQKYNFDDYTIRKETSHVHSVSLQNVETEQHIRANRILTNLEQNTVPRTQKPSRYQDKPTPIWPESIAGLPTEVCNWQQKSSTQRSTESESNIFSFDEEKIQSLQDNSDVDACPDHSFGVVPNIDKTKKIDTNRKQNNFRDIFMEIEPRKIREPLPLHQPIERTKSDPNSLARQRINSNSRRMLLMHQKSIDLTPAESSDDDYLYKQIPSAPPVMKCRGSHFEMPTAEFGHFDVLKGEGEGLKTKFEVPKSQFEVLGAKTQSDLINLPPKSDDIPYVLHKRHIMNGTASGDDTTIRSSDKFETRKSKIDDDEKKSKLTDEIKIKQTSSPQTETESFLFTQNIDLSKVDPVTLEVDKSERPIIISSPKRDITHIDPVLLEALSSKLSQIESDSPTSSKTESLKPQQKLLPIQKDKPQKPEIKTTIEKPQPKQEVELKEPQKTDKLLGKDRIKTDIKPKRIIKPRMQPGKKCGKVNKTKVRITSFSSDDESLDSDDVFGSAEATPTRMEFSPPQTRKEMESILKFESERKYLQYTMSSTEVEGSPPQTRKKADKRQHDNGLDPNVQPELRRISERSFSIPSSEDDLNIKTSDMQPVFAEPTAPESLPIVEETEKDDIDRSLQEVTLKETSENFDEEREKEKLLLQAEIENDLKNLKVPPRTKITEIPCSSSARKKGQSPLLFAHARLNLSEGSAFTLLQKQQATESPIPGRRAKSLDAPVIPVSRLPPLNAFSSKDDTVEEEDRATTTDVNESDFDEVGAEIDKKVEQIEDKLVKVIEKTESPPPVIETTMKKDKVVTGPKPEIKPVTVVKKVNERECDQIVPDVSRSKKSFKNVPQSKQVTQKVGTKAKPSSMKETKTNAAKERPRIPTKSKITPSKAIPPKTSSGKPVVPPRTTSKSTTETTAITATAEITVPPAEKTEEPITLPVPEMKRTKSQEMEPCKKVPPKEKAKSLDKLELKRISSKERTKSQEDSDTDIAKRKEKQQMLYETAIKQTKTVKSPVKDVLPVFPQVEEMVRERHGKLEISINTIENTNVSLEEAIIITKSPKKLDKKMDKKLTQSLELNLTNEEETADKPMQRLGKSLDLDNRPKEETDESTEFNFEAVIKISEDTSTMEISSERQEEESPPQESVQDKIILEGTSLDVWLSVDGQKTSDKLDKIELIKGSADFFEETTPGKPPPDLRRVDTKSSSDSQSTEKVSLGNSLDMKYIDESGGDSSHQSEQDAQLIVEMRKASDTVGKFLRKKLEKKRLAAKIRITSEEESLTEVSEIKGEQDVDTNLLTPGDDRKDVLFRLSTESRSEDTGSWMTVDCEEYVGIGESFECEPTTLDTLEKSNIELENQPEEKAPAVSLLTTMKLSKLDLLKRNSDQSRSSDTTGSWTSGEKDPSPSNIRETDDSSVSCAIGLSVGFSQTIERFATKDQIEKSSPEIEPPKSPRSPRSPRICVLGRAFTIDEESMSQRNPNEEESSSDEAHEIPKDSKSDQDGLKYKKVPYPFEEKWSTESELSQRLHQKIAKKLSGDKGSFSSLDESKNGKLDKPSLYSIEKLSTESRNSIDTESSSGSLGTAARMTKSNDIPKELSSTWRPFPLDSSGSESFDDVLLPPDQDNNGKQEYFLCRDNSGDFTQLSDVCYKSDPDATPTRDDTVLPEDLANFSTNFGYPCLTSNINVIGLNLGAPDVIPGVGFLSRTLSRISERSTNSEKSSTEDDSTKATTQSDSLNDESLASSNPQVSLSSDPPSHARLSEEKKTPTNGPNHHPIPKLPIEELHIKNDSIPSCGLLQRQISDDRRTSAEMAELSIDDIEILTSERGLRLKRQDSDDTIIDEECFDEQQNKNDSQESDEWPLPEIPKREQQQQQTTAQSLLAMHEVLSSDTSQLTTQVFQPPNTNIPKTFGLRGSLKSQDSEQWPSPPSSVVEPPIVSNVGTYYVTPPEEPSKVTISNIETHYVTPPEEAYKVTVDSNTVSTYDNDSNSDNENKLTDLDTEKTHTYENVPISHASESISESLSIGTSGIKIVLDKKSDDSKASNSDDELNLSNLNDDVFTESIDVGNKNELRPPTVMRRSTNSDDSSQSALKNDYLKPTTKTSQSSYSEEDCTSSIGTNIEDGTVRFAFKPTKCTHSSHSEDTSIALSLSEWSNSTNTVKFQNLSSTSGTTKSSSGLKSDDNSLTDIAQSISEWSSSNSNTLKVQQQTTSLQFQKLSSTTTSTGENSTLTDLIPTISEWSSSDTSKTLVAPPPPPTPHQQYYPNLKNERSLTRLGSSVDDGEFVSTPESKGIPSPKNIPSEDLAQLPTTLQTETKFFTIKSTERPILIPSIQSLSDTEKSSSSIEQKTVHTQRYDRDKQRYMQKHHQTSTKSTERPIKIPLKLSKCSPYYSSSLSSESTPLASTSPIPVNKTATVPLTRSHRKPVSKSLLLQTKSPPSENDSTSSVESPKSKSDRDRRGYRRRRQSQNQKRHKIESHKMDNEFYYDQQHQDTTTTPNTTTTNDYIFHYEDRSGRYTENLEEEGYLPDGDSQSGSDIFRMEKDDDDRYDIAEGFDVTSIPPPLLEDDFEDEQSPQI